MAERTTSQRTGKISQSSEVHQTLFENDLVRVLKVEFDRGANSPMHLHRSHVIYVIKPSEMKIITPNGDNMSLRQREGEVRWFEEGTYYEENVGTSEFVAIVTELK